MCVFVRSDRFWCSPILMKWRKDLYMCVPIFLFLCFLFGPPTCAIIKLKLKLYLKYAVK